MNIFLSSRLIQAFGNGFVNCVSVVQQVCMKAAVTVSLKLCLFTVRVLLGSSDRNRAGQAF